MYNIYLENNILSLNNIKTSQIDTLHRWYNMDSFKYAAGIDFCMTHDKIIEKIGQVFRSEKDFFCTINLKNNYIPIGMLKGSLYAQGKDMAWVGLLAIEPAYQNIGYGTEALNLLFDHFKSTLGIARVLTSVIIMNKKGINFWKHLGFYEIMHLEKIVKLDEKDQDAIIMLKNL